MNFDKAQKADVEWRDGVPVSVQFDDPYFSLADGLAESRHVFLAGNNLPERFVEGFHIAELGFGTGLNLLMAWQTRTLPTPLRYTSFEAYPMELDQITTALSNWPELARVAEPLLAAEGRSFHTDTLIFDLIEGDVRETLPMWQGRADAWFLDGFSPARNPEMWEVDLLQQVADHTSPGGTFATYSAAGHVRRGLEAAGFEVERTKGFKHKRHMCRGRLL